MIKRAEPNIGFPAWRQKSAKSREYGINISDMFEGVLRHDKIEALVWIELFDRGREELHVAQFGKSLANLRVGEGDARLPNIDADYSLGAG
jgi:hypothetical protein